MGIGTRAQLELNRDEPDKTKGLKNLPATHLCTADRQPTHWKSLLSPLATKAATAQSSMHWQEGEW